MSREDIFPTDTKFLIVDDSEMIRELVKECLGELNYKNSDCAVNGEDAFQKLINAHDAKVPFQLIILDINMPKMTGIEFLEERTKYEFLKNIPVIMLTTTSEQPMVITAISYGVKGYIIKPFTRDTLETVLQNTWSIISGKKPA